MKRVVFLVCFAAVLLASLFIYQYFKFNDGKLHVVFCDVGQGDGILVTTPNNKQILIDAGPDKKILDCLGRHMPFWDRTIELALLSHPHADHFVGFYYVIDRYGLDQFATENLVNTTDGFRQLESTLKENNLPVKQVAAGDRWVIKDGTKEIVVSIEGPTKEFLILKDPDGVITDSAESASLIIKVAYGDFSVLLTGDAPVDEMAEVAKQQADSLEVLQIPHHGSTTGVDEHVISQLNPKIAVISVGKNNYGHPTKKVLDLLQNRGLTALRTDQKGDIEIVSDGQQASLK